LTHSLFYVLSSHHGEEFSPVRCNQQTIRRLLRYFEDLVTENKLPALVIEGRCLDGQPPRELERSAKLASVARHLYLFSCDGECSTRTWSPASRPTLSVLEEHQYHSIETGPFILVMDPRFCGLLASSVIAADDATNQARTYEMLWTFDPNVVFTAIEYLMARITVQKPRERARFGALLNASTPHSISLRLALTLTTKLTMLMQRQNELEMATSRISSAISSTLELEGILQTAVEEVGHALNARRAALVLWREGGNKPEGMSVYQQPEESSAMTARRRETSRLMVHLQGEATRTSAEGVVSVADAHEVSAFPADEESASPSALEIPITYRDTIIGVLVVEDDTPGRNWEDEEVLMVRTVADQLAVAISHARLFRRIQTQAMTDALTGLYNHGYFQEVIDREVKLADRDSTTVSLILLDIDHLKRINDTLGHQAGDTALRHVADIMKASVREVDVCARYGGEEFVIVLPKCARDEARHVAERVREAIAASPVPKVGQVTASFGVSTYPESARGKAELVEMADRAMYLSKAAGRNRVRTLVHQDSTRLDA